MSRIRAFFITLFSILFIAQLAYGSCLPSIISREGLPFSACEKKGTGCVRSKFAPELYTVPEGISRPHVEASGVWGEGSDAHFYGRAIQPIFTNELETVGGMNTTFVQGSYHLQGDLRTTNLGLVYRQMPRNCRYILGANLFFDKANPHGHRRFSFGGDLETYTSRFYFNVYMPMNDWKVIDDTGRYIERPLSGWEIAASKRFENIPSLELIAKYYRFDRRCLNDIQAFEGQAEFTPYPIITGKAGFRTHSIEDKKNEIYAGCQLNYHFGVPFKEQVTRKTELRPLPKRIHDKVRRVDLVWTEKKDQVLNPGVCGVGSLITQVRTIDTPLDTLFTTDTIQFILNFPSGTGITISGTPRLNFRVGANTRTVGVASFTENQIVFTTYNAVGADHGANTFTGVGFTSFDLSTGSIGATGCLLQSPPAIILSPNDVQLI